jgi:mono/diheme cytochrome c family protein
LTEIPDYLLKRSKDRRAVLSGGTPSAEPSASKEVAKTSTSSAAPALAAEVAPALPPKPDPAYVVAAKTRKKIPFWAMATLSLLPVWAFIYLLAVSPQEREATGPMAIGEAVYGACASCHGAAGQGGAGRVLHEGEVLKTFPHIEDMLNYVYTGSQPFVSAGLAVYGNPDREGGAHAPLSYNGNAMPAQGESWGGGLTNYEILGVVCHERYAIGGADPKSEQWAAEYATWCSEDSEIFAALESGTVDFDTLAETFSMLETPPREVGTQARPSNK